jgi:hypothetical protein
MAFSAKQVKALRRSPHHRHIRTREANGRELSYLEGWYAISEANRIFGFDGWSRETIESKCVLAPGAAYGAGEWGDRYSGGAWQRRGEGHSPGEVHDIALRQRKLMPPSGLWRHLAGPLV